MEEARLLLLLKLKEKDIGRKTWTNRSLSSRVLSRGGVRPGGGQSFQLLTAVLYGCNRVTTGERRPLVEDRFSSGDGCGRDIARDNGATMRLIHQCDNVRAHKLTPSKLLEYRVQQGSMYRNEISVCNALNKLPPIASIYLVSLSTNKKIVDRIRNLIKILLYTYIVLVNLVFLNL